MPLPDQPLLFDFEIVSSENLTYIPMCVRFNLDRCGIRLTLAQWQALPHADRVALVQMPLALGSTPDGSVDPAAGCFAARLHERVAASSATPLEFQTPSDTQAGSVSPLWEQEDAVPQPVLRQCALHQVPLLGVAAWRGLDPLRRYVLLKLSRRDTPNHDFLPALHEFGLL
jgi:hypothetical protein